MATATTTAATGKTYAERATDDQYQAFLKWDAEKSPGSPYTTPGSPFYDTPEQYDSLQKNGYPKQFLSETGATAPGGGGAGSTGNAGVAIPEPTVSARSAYGSAGNQSAGIATNTGAQSLSGPEAANPSLGKRIYPQHMRALAALAPRVY